MLDSSGSGRALNPVVYRCRPLPDVIDDVNRRAVVSSRAITQMHQALNDRLDDAISHLTDSLAPLPKRGLKERRWRCKKLNVFCLADDANWRNSERMVAKRVATVTYIYSTLNRYDPTSLLILVGNY